MAGDGGTRRQRLMVPACGAALLLLAVACAPVSLAPDPASRISTPGVAATTPTARSAQPSQRDLTEWPGPDNTGVPPGTELTPWTGDCTITRRGTVIDAKLVQCDLRIRAADVVITRSRIEGNVLIRHPDEGHSFSITDSEVHAGSRLVSGLGDGNFTALRVEVTGGRRSAYCSSNCVIEDSWLHAQSGDDDGEAHLSGIRMGQDTVLRGNTIVCEGERIPPASGCSAAITGYGDFAPVKDNLIEGNLILSGTASFCAFGGSTRDKPFSDEASGIRFVDNVFERNEEGSCGIHGPIEAFDDEAPGNVWSGNVWTDGEPVPPRN